MRDSLNARHLLEEAVRLLATGEGDIKDRLFHSYVQKFQYVLPEDVPPDLSSLVESVQRQLTREPLYEGQSTVESAMYRMRRRVASTIAGHIFEVHLAMARRS